MFPSHWEVLVIFLVILLLFGARRIPEMAQGLGKGIREFRKAVKDVQEEVDITGTIQPPPAPAGQVARQPEATAAVPQPQAANQPATQPQTTPQTSAEPQSTQTQNDSGVRS